MTNDVRISRRSALKAGVALAAGTAAGDGLSGTALADDVRRFEGQQSVDPKSRILLKGGTIVSMDAKVGDLAKGDLLIEGSKNLRDRARNQRRGCAGDRCGRYHHRAGPGRLPSAFLGRAAAPHQSEFADACRLYERHTSVVRQILSAARSLCRQLSHRHGLHRCRRHLRDRQFPQFAQRRPFRCRGGSAVRFRHPRRARVGAARRRRMGSSMAAGSRAAAKEIFLVDRPARDVAHVLWADPR